MLETLLVFPVPSVESNGNKTHTKKNTEQLGSTAQQTLLCSLDPSCSVFFAFDFSDFSHQTGSTDGFFPQVSRFCRTSVCFREGGACARSVSWSLRISWWRMMPTAPGSAMRTRSNDYRSNGQYLLASTVKGMTWGSPRAPKYHQDIRQLLVPNSCAIGTINF